MSQVLNKYKDGFPIGSIYIGRSKNKEKGIYGNKFEIGTDGNREEVVKKDELWIVNQPELIHQIKSQLPGKDLVCFCKPKPCHGDIRLKIANTRYLDGLIFDVEEGDKWYAKSYSNEI